MTKKWFALFSVLSLVVFLGAGCGGDDSSTNSSNKTSAVEDTTKDEDEETTEDTEEGTDEESGEEAEEAAEGTVYGMNEKGTLGDITYEVTGAELLADEIPTEYHTYADTIGEPKPADEGRDWLRLEVTMTNDGNEKASLFGSYFIVENSEGQKIESSNDATSYASTEMNPVLASDIQSGASKEYVMYFDIPEGSEELKFLAPDVADSFNENADTLTFELTVE